MSPIGRIFLVLNLILSAAFLGWASNALGTTETYKARLEAKEAEMAAAIADKDEEISQLQVELRDTTETQRRIREERDQLDADRSRLETQAQELQREKDKLLGDVTAIQETLSDYNDTIRQITEAKDRAVEQAHEMERQRDDAATAQQESEGARRDAEDAQRGLERLIADLEVEREGLRKDVSKLETRLQVLVEVTGVNYEDILAQEKIDGAVLGVRMDLEPGLVMLNVGSEDGVKRGYTFDVYRGNKYKGQVRVERVQPNQCSALVVRPVLGASIQQGDLASTRML